MSRKTKSELSFILKITILFVILLTSKLNKTSDLSLTSNTETISQKGDLSIITASIRN